MTKHIRKICSLLSCLSCDELLLHTVVCMKCVSCLFLALIVLQGFSHGSETVCWRPASESSHSSRVKWDGKQDMVQTPAPCLPTD